jgi:hypothetical protein
MLFSRLPSTEALLCFGLPTRGVEASLADSSTQWHACLTIVGNRKLKIILLYYNALERVPLRAKAGSGQDGMRRAEAFHHHQFALFARGVMARRPSPDQQWRSGPHGFGTGDEARAKCRFLWYWRRCEATPCILTK